MKDLLRRLLTPDDDGRAFTDAVLLRASGALHRRRLAVEAAAAQLPAWDWLARWAKPWVVAALVLLAVVAMIPARPWTDSRRTVAASPADSEALVASLLPADMALASATDAIQER